MSIEIIFLLFLSFVFQFHVQQVPAGGIVLRKQKEVIGQTETI